MTWGEEREGEKRRRDFLISFLRPFCSIWSHTWMEDSFFQWVLWFTPKCHLEFPSPNFRCWETQLAPGQAVYFQDGSWGTGSSQGDECSNLTWSVEWTCFFCPGAMPFTHLWGFSLPLKRALNLHWHMDSCFEHTHSKDIFRFHHTRSTCWIALNPVKLALKLSSILALLFS